MTEKMFWETKTLDEFSREEWESLCDGCGRCCLHKLEDIDTGELLYTNIICELFDNDSCRCTRYQNRQTFVPTCVVLTPDEVRNIHWLPETCAYRLIRDGLPLEWWHPLVSGDPQTVIEAGISVKDHTIPETYVHADDWENHIVDLSAGLDSYNEDDEEN